MGTSQLVQAGAFGLGELQVLALEGALNLELRYFRLLLSSFATSLLWFTRSGLDLQPQLDQEAK